jgi:hypothetical protein
MSFSSALGVVWLVGLMLQVSLAGVLVSKKLWRKSPAFTIYVLFSLVETLVALGVYHNQTLYFYTYIIGESVLVILGLALVYEIFAQLCAAQAELRKLATRLFLIVVILLVILAGAVIYTHSPIGQVGLRTAILAIEEAARLLEVGLIVFLFLFSGAFGLHWRQQIFGTALGFGLSTTTELVTVTMASYVSPAGAWSLNIIHVLSFDLSLLIWIGYILVPEPATVGELPKREQLEQWNRAVTEFMHQ